MDTPLDSRRFARSAALAALVIVLTGCGGYGSGNGYGAGSMTTTPTNTTISGPILPTLAMTTTIGSTLDPNPYGLTVAMATAGPITSGDLIACNFNDAATNTQGMGTTVIGMHPTAGAMPYRIAQSIKLLGCSSITSLPDGSLVATGSQAHDTVLISPAGAISTPFAGDVFVEPWSAIYATHSGSAYVYVSNAMSGTIDRITLNGDAQSSFTEIASGFSTNNGVPGSISAPAGLSYDAANDTLYVVDTNANHVVSLSNVSAIETNGVMVTSDTVSGATFAGASAGSAKVIASGAPLNGPISGALLVNGDLVVGNTLDPAGTNLIIEISTSTGQMVSRNVDTGAAGAIFGIVAVPKTITTMGAYGSTTNTLTNVIYFNDDNDNTVKLLSQ